MDNPIIEKWNELKKLVEDLEHDIVKNAKGVAAAGVRARKNLRHVKALAADIVKLTLEANKAEKSEKVDEEPTV